ncbi:MAG TPA: YcnI family protein [Symbiobacteriaceae bacterium]
MKRFVGLLTILGVLVVAGVASAHVTVWPKQSQANGYERYTVRVPTEKEIPTVKVRVELPEGTTFSGVLPVPGWKFDTEKDGSGKVVALDWSGGEIKKGEFFEFGVSVRNPKTAGPVVWKAYQTYSDGSVVEWNGPTGASTPAPAVTLTEAPATGTQEHSAPAAATPAAPAASAAPAPAPVSPTPAPAANPGFGTWLGSASLLISVIALFLALRKR